MEILQLKPCIIIEIISWGFYGNEVIELSVILKVTSIVAFAVTIFEADELNISRDCSLGGFEEECLAEN